jgi:two-component system NarL family response regulator
MTKQEAIRVIVADDHPVVREGLAALIERQSDMSVVGEAGNGQEAIELFRQQRPDVALMDLRMPQVDGIGAIQTIHAEFPNAHILVLTTYEGDEDIYRGLRAGAQGYLLKDSPRETLLEAIRAASSGQTRLPTEMAAKLAERLRSPEMTARELEVLQLIAAGHSNQEIAKALFIAESTVKAHVNSILSKLGVNDRTQAVMKAVTRGIIHLG